MGKFIDETSNRYGSWTVLKRDEAYPSVGRWVCRCDCGTIKTLYGSELRNGRSTSCGCNQKKNLVGQIFGKLKVIKKSDNNKDKWICECECGRTKEVFGGHLTSGKTKSCGVYPCKENKKITDLTGQKFGSLTVVKRDETRHEVYYICQCDCGNIKSVSAKHLRSGKIISCGCYNRSKGEDKIKNLLTENNYDFENEYVCKDLIFKSGKPARFDFKVLIDNNFYFIEFDGIQHFKEYDLWGGKTSLQSVQEHDSIKNDFCKENKIPLIRIPYNKYKSLSMNDLNIYTSQYIKVRGWLDELS